MTIDDAVEKIVKGDRIESSLEVVETFLDAFQCIDKILKTESPEDVVDKILKIPGADRPFSKLLICTIRKERGVEVALKILRTSKRKLKARLPRQELLACHQH